MVLTTLILLRVTECSESKSECSLDFLFFFNVKEEDKTMKWETPEYSDIRFGFEVTMYINNK